MAQYVANTASNLLWFYDPSGLGGTEPKHPFRLGILTEVGAQARQAAADLQRVAALCDQAVSEQATGADGRGKNCRGRSRETGPEFS